MGSIVHDGLRTTVRAFVSHVYNVSTFSNHSVNFDTKFRNGFSGIKLEVSPFTVKM
jgi:hypothetical protein